MVENTLENTMEIKLSSRNNVDYKTFELTCIR